MTGSRKAGATGQERGEREGHRGAAVEEIATRAQEEEEEPEKSKRRRGATEGCLVEILASLPPCGARGAMIGRPGRVKRAKGGDSEDGKQKKVRPGLLDV